MRVWDPSRILFLFDNLGLVLALDKGRCSHNFTFNSILGTFSGLQVVNGHKFYFHWITSEWISSDAGSRFFSLSVHVPDNLTTTETSSVLHGAQALDGTRNNSNTFQRWVLLILRLLEHHEEFAKTCFTANSSVFTAPPRLSVLHHASCAASCGGCLVPRRSVEKTTRVPTVRSKLQSKLSGEETVSPRPPETLISEMQCYHSL